MSLAEDILIIFTNYSGGYSLMRDRITGYTGPHKSSYRNSVKDSVLRVTLSRLRKKGLVENKNGIWKITRKGLDWLNKKTPLPRHQKYFQKKKSLKNMIIVFDIPETAKKKRNWLRFELMNMGFAMLQKSVWFGPAPLHEDFINAIKEIGIIQHLKFFGAKEDDIV